MIEVKHLTKRYGSNVAVNDISFRVEEGEIVGFLGPNGAGKSTTMNILTGYLSATDGDVTIGGYDILENPNEAKKQIGYLPELPPLYLDMTVKEYLDFMYDLKQVTLPRKEHIEEICRLVQITNVYKRLIRNLSKGYRQRVGLAQAILGYPEIIILDEPTVGLDPKQIIEIRSLIKKLGENHTVILSSHILTEISAVCDHVFIISKGKLVASDKTEKLLERMTGSQQIELLVKGEKTLAEDAITSIPEVEHCELLEEKEAGTSLMRITAKKDADIRESVFLACAESKMPILEMKAAEKSLEDVFLELTGKGGAEA